MRSRQAFCHGVLLAVAACMTAWCGEPGYIDSSVCASCHRQAAEGYARSGMARSFGAVRAALGAQPPPGQFHHDLTEQDYTVYRRNGKLYLRRSVTGHDDKPADILEVAMGYWIGSGNHARSYLSRGVRGKLVELPLTWYPANGGHWAMSPGYDLPLHAGFTRRITFGCLFCHAGYPDLPPGTDQDDGGWKLPDPLVEGIDCQRCHGPGQAHVDAAKQGQAPDRVRAAIVNPKKLDSQRGMEVCLQCHLETTSVRLPGFIRSYDRGAFSYRPGQPLEDYLLHFDRATRGGPEGPEFVSQAYRMRMSACFRESKGALTCTTCHNPHDIPRGEAATRAYAAVCQSCHGPAVAKLVESGKHTESEDCAGCHMPKRKPVDALHTVVSDHYIQKRPDAEATGIQAEYNDTTAVPYRGEVALYYPPERPKTPAFELYLALAQVMHRANLQAGLPRLDTLVRQMQPAQGEFYLELAEAWRHAGQNDRAVAYARQAVERMPGKWRAWHSLGNMLIAAGDPAQAGEALKRALALALDEPSVAHTLGEAYGRQGMFREALAAFQSAVAADPEFAEGHNNLGTTFLRMGDMTAAERELREAVRLRPESAAMQVNLASFLARRGTMPEARRRFDLALKINPAYAEGHAAYGLALAANREWSAARLRLQEAIRLNPKAPVPHHNLGVVLVQVNDAEGALAEFRSAVQLDPNYYEAHLELGRMLVQRGQMTEADLHLRKAAESPDNRIKQSSTGLLR